MDKIRSLAERFMGLFSGLSRAHGKYTITGVNEQKGKMAGKAITVHEPVTVEKWEAHLLGKQGIGIVPIRDDATVMFGAIDIDKYDIDHPAVEARMTALGIPGVVCRTKSGGVHIYVFASEPITAKVMRGKLMEFAVALGHPGVEVFPKQIALANERDFGNWINIPYFDGDRTTRYAYRQGSSLGVEEFLQFAESTRINEETLAGITIQVGDEEFADAPPCLQQLAACGVPPGNRNNALMNFGVYARLKFSDDWETELERINHQCITPPLPSREVITIAKSLNRKNYFYTCNQSPLVNCCNKELCKTRAFGIGNGDEPDVTIKSLTKIASEKPTWIVDVEGMRIELETEDLVNQERFRRIVMERLNLFPRKMKQNDWERIIKGLLATCEVVEAPPDAGPEGQFWHYVESYCTTKAQARVKDELLQGKPWTDEVASRTYFRGPDLMRYLEQQHFREFSERQMWAALRRHNGDHCQMRIKDKTVQLWHIPAFEKQTEEFDIPRTDEAPF